MQEIDSTVYAEVDVLLNLEEYQRCVPDTLACYLPYGTQIVYEKILIPVSSIISECQKPLSLLKWDNLNKTLHQVEESVCIILIGIILCY